MHRTTNRYNACDRVKVENALDLMWNLWKIDQMYTSLEITF